MERKPFQYPCLADIMHDCPSNCSLHQNSVRNILIAANQEGQTPAEYLEILRSGTPEMIQTLNRLTVKVIKDAFLLEECQNVLERKIDYIKLLLSS